MCLIDPLVGGSALWHVQQLLGWTMTRYLDDVVASKKMEEAKDAEMITTLDKTRIDMNMGMLRNDTDKEIRCNMTRRWNAGDGVCETVV